MWQGYYDLQVSTNNILKHRTLSTRLTTDDNDLWQVDRIIYTNSCEDILKLVDKPRGSSQLPYYKRNIWEDKSAYLIKAGSEMPPEEVASAMSSV